MEQALLLFPGKNDARRRKGWQRTRSLGRITDSMGMSLSKLWEMVKDREAWHAAVHRVAKSRTQLSDWTTTRWAVRDCKIEALYLSLQAHSGPLLATSLCLAPYPLCWDPGLSTGSIFCDWCPRCSEFQSSPGRKSRFQREKTWGVDGRLEQSRRTSQMSWPWKMLGLPHI